MIDTHCHLTSPKLADSYASVLDRAEEAGVDGMINVSTSSMDCVEGLAVAKKHPRIWCTSGIHPHEAEAEHDWNAIRLVAEDDRCVAWGELGLDWYYKDPPRDAQFALLDRHLEVIQSASGRQATMPIVLHCREAYDDLIAILRTSGIAPERCIFHCFTGDAATVDTVLEFGAWVSFTGIVTFGNAPEIQEAAARVPLERMLVETDAPYLSPEPVRSMRPNEPCNVVHTARFLAELRGIEADDFIGCMDSNAVRCFGLEDGG
jgi:TatD DNase family protein